MTAQSSGKSLNSKKTLFTRFLDSVEYLGNLYPDPITLFAIFCVAILILLVLRVILCVGY